MQPRKNSDTSQSPGILDYLSDLRVIRAIAQIVFVVIIVFSVAFLWSSIASELDAKNIRPNFDFLSTPANFAIGQSPDWYTSANNYFEAFMVGVINTLQIVGIGLVAATILGVLLGIFLLGQNWLVRTISRVYVEILRNTPLLVQLIFWYFVVWLGLPNSNVSFPDESVMTVPLRYFPYLFALIGVLIYAWRVPAPSRLITGFLAGISIAEAAFWLASDNYVTIIILGLIGAVAIVIANRDDIVPKGYGGLVQGIGAMLLVQLVGHLILDGMGATGILANSRAIYGEVLPIFILGPSLFGMPNFGLSPNFMLFSIITAVGIVISVGLYIYWGGVVERTGANIPRLAYAVVIIIVAGGIGWFVSGSRQVTDGTQLSYTMTVEDLEASGLLEVEQIESLKESRLNTPHYAVLAGVILVGAILAMATTPLFTSLTKQMGVSLPSVAYVVVFIVIFAGIGWFAGLKAQKVSDATKLSFSTTVGELQATELLDEYELAIVEASEPILVQPPQLRRIGSRLAVGNSISPNYMALLVGLVIYTSAFIGEIVRAGIQAVPWGQVEASRALGFSTAQTLQMIVLPQALRVIIPPLGNQYLNLSKNSSLATIIAYADTYQVGQTMMNQSGQSIPGFVMVLVVYLSLSLLISLVMNLVNSRFQLVTR